MSVRRAICPGTFDPVTLGHLDVIGRAAALFDEVVVAIGVNPAKTRLFTDAERLDMLREACAGHRTVRVAGFTGLLTDFCVAEGITAIVKGLRAGSDFDYELQMAQMNAGLAPGVETVFLPASPQFGFVASSLVKEVAAYGGDVSAYLPGFVHDRLLARLAERSGTS